VVENLDRNKNIYSLLESQAAIIALSTSKLVWDCHQFLMQLAEHNRLQLIRVRGHEGIDDNDMADQLAILESERSFIGPEPKAVRDWKFRDNIKGFFKWPNALIQGPSANKTRELLKLKGN
jgi:hypothetical protein